MDLRNKELALLIEHAIGCACTPPPAGFSSPRTLHDKADAERLLNQLEQAKLDLDRAIALTWLLMTQLPEAGQPASEPETRLEGVPEVARYWRIETKDKP